MNSELDARIGAIASCIENAAWPKLITATCFCILVMGCGGGMTREKLERRTPKGLSAMALVMVLDARGALDSVLTASNRDSILSTAEQSLSQTGLSIRRRAEGKITDEGLKLVSGEMKRADINTPAIVFSTTRLVPIDESVSESHMMIAVEVFQSVRMDRNRDIQSYVATWGRRRVLPLSQVKSAPTKRALMSMLGEFIQEYREINSGEEEIPPI